jgi:anti-anti-sigma regulatory factor
MASNFKISANKNGDNLHYNLTGEFDGSSAMKLMNMLKKCGKRYHSITIHTSGLTSINIFGQEVFLSNFSELNEIRHRLRFTGEHSDYFQPERDALLGSA